MSDEELYAGREQTLVKHYILEHYLERFAHKVGSFWNAITYVDCFAGPWNARSDRLEDSSFALAIQQLRRARQNLADFRMARGLPRLEVRCFFLEKNASAYGKLQEFVKGVTDVEIETRNATLEDSIQDIMEFVCARQNDSFPFIFVDPTGWTGFGLNVIEPLLKLQPGEVLINFMTGFIIRFAKHPEESVQKGFSNLFGSIDYLGRTAGLIGQEREDQLVRCYAEAVKEAGRFKYVCRALAAR